MMMRWCGEHTTSFVRSQIYIYTHATVKRIEGKKGEVSSLLAWGHQKDSCQSGIECCGGGGALIPSLLSGLCNLGVWPDKVGEE